jgi:allantoin racemase
MRIMFLNQSPLNPRASNRDSRVQDLLRSYCSPGTELDLLYPDDFEGARVMRTMGGQSILTGLHHAMATAALIRKTVWAQDNGYDAVIQSNTFDPGVEPGRLAVRIPVIGVLRTTLHVAANLADRIGITVPLEGHVPYTWRIVRSYGMQDFVTDIRAVGVYGEDIDARKDELFDNAVKTMKGVIRDTSPHCIIPLGGALIPYVVDPADLQKEVGIPVLNTKAIGINFAEMCVRTGMSHSPVTYPSGKLRYEDFTAHAFD